MKITVSNHQVRQSGPMGFIARTIILTLAIIIAIRILPGVRIEGNSVVVAIITALVISVLDNFIRPILIFITLPFTVLTMGMFVFIINALIIEMAAAIVGPFQVDSFGYALLFSLVITLLNYLLELPNRWLNKTGYKHRQGDGEEGFTDYEEVE
ncbi:MAG: phage holin family protein [Bacteroidales bacterium]|nr:phage holin family protein [Bacteroidales bacterium]MBQ7279142.1 phage holin family protein [Bacteroidales bacterium]